MAYSKLISVFNNEDTSVDNVINILSLDIDEVFLVYHYDLDQKNENAIRNVVSRYSKTKVHFVEIHKDEEIGKIIDDNPDIICDISGGRYLTMILFEAALSHNSKIIYYDDEENCIKSYREHKVIVSDVFKLNIKDIIELGGGNITRNMHVNPSDGMTNEIVKKCVESSLNAYPQFIAFIQRLNSTLSHAIKVNDVTYRLSDNAMNKLKSEDLYSKYQNFGLYETKDNYISFPNNNILEMINISGAFLESYLYILLKNSGYFDDVMMSAVVDFSSKKMKYQVVCEIDCIIIKNNKLLFVSCKSNKVETPALNEIKMHDNTFGNKLSNSVLCTLDDLNIKSPSIYAKAKELEVAVIDKTAFMNGDVPEQFLSIIEDTYNYENLPE